MNDLTVNSVYGKVFINSASGKVFVETLKADVEFVNKDSEDVTLKVGGNLNAEGLVGAVNVTVDGAATLSFDRFTQDSVVTGNGSSTITIKLYNTKKGEFVYSLKALEVQVLKYNPEDPSDTSNLEVPGSSVTSENIVGPKLTATNTGKIVVYCRNKDN